MNAGKSTVLLQSSYNYRERGMDTLLYTPSIDTRYGMGKITSRIGLSSDAIVIESEHNIFDDVKSRLEKNPKISCVLVDEVQFLKKQQILQLAKICDCLDIPVLCYGIRTDFMGEPFEGSKYMLAWADNISELKTICHCGRKATMNMRIDEDGKKLSEGEQVQIGGNESYIATCRLHFNSGESGVARVDSEAVIKSV